MKKLLVISLMVLVLTFATSGCYVALQAYPNITGYWTFTTTIPGLATQLIHIWSDNFGGLGGMTHGAPFNGFAITGTISGAKFGIPAKMEISFTHTATGNVYQFSAELDDMVLRYQKKMTGTVTRTLGAASTGGTFEAEWEHL